MPAPVDIKVEPIAGLQKVAPQSPKVGPDYRRRSVWQRLLEWWGGFSLEKRFSIATAVVLTIAMIVLGHWVERRVRAGWTQTMAEIAATYLEAVVAPYLDEVAPSGRLPPAAEEKLRNLVGSGPLGPQVKIIKIWSTEGKLLFSTVGEPRDEQLRQQQLSRLLRGEIIAPAANHGSASPNGLIEIYAPIHDPSHSRVVLIGEFYKRSDLVDGEINQLKYAIWFLVFHVGCIVALILYALIRRASRVIARQQAELEANLARAAGLARRNSILRRAADRARLNAAVTNEEYLSRIGADLHDGPIQMLSLMMLRLPPETANPALKEVREQFLPLIDQTLAELRSLTSGLVLPEIRELSPAATIESAVTRHERYTGSTVTRHFGDLPADMPEAIRICAFRVVQEALMNAYKHAGGANTSVATRFQSGFLHIVVEDGGNRDAAKPETPASTGEALGLRGMKTRVAALNGTLAVSRRETGGMVVQVRLPVRARSLNTAIDLTEEDELPA